MSEQQITKGWGLLHHPAKQLTGLQAGKSPEPGDVLVRAARSSTFLAAAVVLTRLA